VRRGIIATTKHRDTNPTLDAFDIAELDTVWSDLKSLTSRETESAE
jgi:hypothetical protein